MKAYSNGQGNNDLFIILDSEGEKAYMVFGNLPIIFLDYKEALRITESGEFHEMCPDGVITILLIDAVRKRIQG